MDIKPFYPINTEEKVRLLIDAIKANTEYVNLNVLETKIILNIRSLKTQIYFKERFKILKDNYSLTRQPRKRITYVSLVAKSPKTCNEPIQKLSKPKKIKKPSKRLITAKAYKLNYRQENLKSSGAVSKTPSKYKGIRGKRAIGNLNYFKVIYTNHPKS